MTCAVGEGVKEIFVKLMYKGELILPHISSRCSPLLSGISKASRFTGKASGLNGKASSLNGKASTFIRKASFSGETDSCLFSVPNSV